MNETLIEVGNRIKEIRAEKNITQEELSKNSGLDRSYVSSIENGKRNSTIKAIDSIAKALGVSLSDIFKGI